LQFNASSGEAFLFDCGSTHGTFLNRQRLKPGAHVPLRWKGGGGQPRLHICG
jgi:pSer/pThr/pTyr-binding forkhead associated (FHA) protein